MRSITRPRGFLALLLAILAVLSLGLVLTACGDDDEESGPSPVADPEADPEAGSASATTVGDRGTITVYSGRTETLIAPLLEQFTDATGIGARVRYGETAELAATIIEEGDRSPADVFLAQDAGALGALQGEGRFVTLPEDLLDQVAPAFRSPEGQWIGVSGRARVVAYNTDELPEEDLPDSILDYTDAEWRGRIGWVPTNGSFQAFVTGLRVQLGEDVARDWLEGIAANDPEEYPNNIAAVQAVADGEVDVAFVNHYYLFQIREDRGDVPVANHYLSNGDPGALVNVAGVGVLSSSDDQDLALEFVRYLLSTEAQQYFADETFEYPLSLTADVEPIADLPPLAELEPPDLDLSSLSDLEGTLELLRETGVLP